MTAGVTLAPHGGPAGAAGRSRPWTAVAGTARRHPGGALGLAMLGLVVIVAALAPVIAPYGSDEKVGRVFEAPSSAHLLGLDDAGVDMLTVMLWGARASLIVGFAAAVIAIFIGGVVGVLAGYLGGRTDTVLMRATDYMLVIPDVPLLLIVATLWGRSLLSIILIIALLSWAATARVVRAQAKSVREYAYVRRARAVGAGNARIIAHHVLPQIAPVLVTLTVFAVGSAVFEETAIAFLGLGDPNVISWGGLIYNAFDGQAISRDAWWALLPPGLAVGALILSCMLVGRSLEETLNPRLRSGHLSVRSFRIKALQLEDADRP